MDIILEPVFMHAYLLITNIDGFFTVIVPFPCGEGMGLTLFHEYFAPSNLV